MDNKFLGSKLKYLRKERKITGEKLAEMCDLSVGSIRQIERGERGINIDVLITFCDVFQTTPDYFLCNYLSASSQKEHEEKQIIINAVPGLTPWQTHMARLFIDGLKGTAQEPTI